MSEELVQRQIKRVIVTGVTGQDGSYMADYLLANTDHEVYGMVRRTAKPDYGNIADAMKSPRFHMVVGDLSDAHSIDTLVKEIKPDYFINFAAQSFVGSSWQIGEQTLDVTGLGTYRCLEAIRKHAPQCRFYGAGSSEQFGEVECSPQDENHPFRPQSPYGAAKCLSHYLVRVYRKSYGLYAVQGLLYNHESPRRGEEFVTRKITKGVARIARAIKDRKAFEPIELGNLDAMRDWSHAKDFVEGVWRMVNQGVYRSDWDECHLAPHLMYRYIDEYILASGETHSIREFAELAFKEAGFECWWEGAGLDEALYIGIEEVAYCPEVIPVVRVSPKHFRPAEVALLHGNPARAKAELGWSPKYTFRELVREMVQSDLREVGL
jgi:GDPmannose 4,6-dehydratase